jgi:hypothetical protein
MVKGVGGGIEEAEYECAACEDDHEEKERDARLAE